MKMRFTFLPLRIRRRIRVVFLSIVGVSGIILAVPGLWPLHAVGGLLLLWWYFYVKLRLYQEFARFESVERLVSWEYVSAALEKHQGILMVGYYGRRVTFGIPRIGKMIWVPNDGEMALCPLEIRAMIAESEKTGHFENPPPFYLVTSYPYRRLKHLMASNLNYVKSPIAPAWCLVTFKGSP